MIYWLTKLGWFLVVVGVAGEGVCEALVSKADGQMQTLNDILLTNTSERALIAEATARSFDARIAEARRVTSEAQRDAGLAKQKASEADLARVKIEAQVAWRRLTEQQKMDIGLALRSFSGEAVIVMHNTGDIEGSSFAADIAEALRAAHTFRVSAPGAMSRMAPFGNFDDPIRRIPSGVNVLSTGEERSTELAKAVVHELTSRGYDAVKQTDPSSSHTVWIFIEPRPNGPQGEFKLAEQKLLHTRM